MLVGALVPLVAGALSKVTAVCGNLRTSSGSFGMFARLTRDGGRLGNLGLPAVTNPRGKKPLLNLLVRVRSVGDLQVFTDDVKCRLMMYLDSLHELFRHHRIGQILTAALVETSSEVVEASNEMQQIFLRAHRCVTELSGCVPTFRI